VGERCSPKYFLVYAILQNDVRTQGNGDIVALHQIGLQRNAKSMAKVKEFFY